MPGRKKTMKTQNMKRLNYNFLIAGLFLLLTGACSTTKHLAEGEVLYIGTPTPEIVNYEECDAGEKTLEEVMGAINVAPNNSLFGSPSKRIPFPFGLWIYNRFERYEKESGNGYSTGWLPIRFMFLLSIRTLGAKWLPIY